MTIRNLVLFSNRNVARYSRSFATRAKRSAEKDIISEAINNLDLKRFSDIVLLCKLEGIPPASLKANDKPILMDICSRLQKDYRNSPRSLYIYRHMLGLLTDTITPENYSEWFDANTPLTLLAKTNETSIAWYLNKILSINKLKIDSLTVGINGTEDYSKPYYGRDIPIIHATLTQSYWGLQVLLQHGANPNIKDANRKTPLDYALGRNPEIIELLKGAGAFIRVGVFP